MVSNRAGPRHQTQGNTRVLLLSCPFLYLTAVSSQLTFGDVPCGNPCVTKATRSEGDGGHGSGDERGLQTPSRVVTWQ
jgi:hypothetical protein